MATQSITPAPDGASPLLADYIDRASLARELNRTLRTIDRLVLCEGLPCVRVGNRRLFRREAVLAWFRSKETPAPAPRRNGRSAR
jgi:excisionase family DNA binding protein